MMGSVFFWLGLVGLFAGAATLAWAAAKHPGARGAETWPRVSAEVRHPDDPRHAVLETKSHAAPAALTGSLLALASVTVLFAALLVSR